MSQHDPVSVELVSPWDFIEVAKRPSLHNYVRQLWQRRYFIWADAGAKAFSTSRGTILGRIWLILRPFLDSLTYFIIFGVVLGTRRGVDNFPAYLVIGVNFFQLMQAGISSGSSIIFNSMNVIKAFSFPRFSLVLSWAIRTLLDFLPVLLVTIVFILLVPPGVSLTPLMFLILPLVLLGGLMMTGLAAITSSLTSLIPDLKFIWPMLGRFWFYSSGVFFVFETMIDDRVLLAILRANPGYMFLHMARSVLMYETMPSSGEWLQMLMWSLGLFFVGLLVFWRKEESYGYER